MNAFLGFMLGSTVAGCAAVLSWALARGRQIGRTAALERQQAILEARLAAESASRTDLQRLLDEARTEQARVTGDLAKEGQCRASAEATASRLPALEQHLAATQRDLSTLQAEHATVLERLAQARTEVEGKVELLREAEIKFKDAFSALSTEALRKNNEQFLALATTRLAGLQEVAVQDLEARQQSIDALVKPVHDSLAAVNGRLLDLEKGRIAAEAQLGEQLRGLIEDHLPRLQKETAGLSRALRQPAVRGRWGELQLRRVVELAGMVDHCDFHEQESVDSDEGRVRPDLIVRLPGGRNVVVDAKAPIGAYIDAMELEEGEARRLKLEQHARQVRAHITSLSRREYWSQFEPTPEFVVMFLPGEALFSAALEHDPGLIEHGASLRVIPATPTTLIATLRAVAYGWRQEAMARNAQEVADLGRELYRRVARLAEQWGRVGQRLGQTLEAYNAAVGSLESRVLVSARRLRDLGAAPEAVEIEELQLVGGVVRGAGAEGGVLNEETAAGTRCAVRRHL